MRKMQEFIVQGKRIFIGLEDSKKTWRLCVRSEGMVVHTTSMPTLYEALRAYLLERYPDCTITVMYEAGFQGFWLHDLLAKDGIRCVVTPPNKVSGPKDERVKTDKRDAYRLAMNLESGDYVPCCVPDKERREEPSDFQNPESDSKKHMSGNKQDTAFSGLSRIERRTAGRGVDRQRLPAAEGQGTSSFFEGEPLRLSPGARDLACHRKGT